MHQLFEDADLRELNAHLSNHELLDQAQLVAEAKLDLAAFVMEEDAEFLREVIRKYGLDVVSPQDMQGLIARHPWLSVGRIPAGRYDLVRSIPASDKLTAQLATLLVASPCARGGPIVWPCSCWSPRSFRGSLAAILRAPQARPRW
jgi:hypothetical protein